MVTKKNTFPFSEPLANNHTSGGSAVVASKPFLHIHEAFYKLLRLNLLVLCFASMGFLLYSRNSWYSCAVCVLGEGGVALNAFFWLNEFHWTLQIFSSAATVLWNTQKENPLKLILKYLFYAIPLKYIIHTVFYQGALQVVWNFPPEITIFSLHIPLLFSIFCVPRMVGIYK